MIDLVGIFYAKKSRQYFKNLKKRTILERYYFNGNEEATHIQKLLPTCHDKKLNLMTLTETVGTSKHDDTMAALEGRLNI